MSGGFPHSEIPGSKGALASPGLIAECHVLHRLLPPRHPPNALIALDPSRKTTGEPRSRPVRDQLGSFFPMDRGTGSRPARRVHGQHSRLGKIDPDHVRPVRAGRSTRDLISSLFTMSMRPRSSRGTAKGPNESGMDEAAPAGVVEPAGIEPATLCLQSRCSPS